MRLVITIIPGRKEHSEQKLHRIVAKGVLQSRARVSQKGFLQAGVRHIGEDAGKPP